ncbi:MAG: metallophosphoesterase [Firmicutes bacterium]|nr:metallophosphoesterase [Bacillota bacterium]
MKKIIAVVLILIISIFLYGKYFEVNNFKIKEYTINNNKIPKSFENLKIVHFSDILYVSKNKDKLTNLIENVNKIKPDIIIFSGDLFNNNEKYSTEDFDFLKSSLNEMEASLYKYAVIGDNDKKFLDNYKDILYDSEFNLLDNQNTLLFYKDITPINIIGLTNIDNVAELLDTDVEYEYSLAIVHEPDNFTKLSEYDIDTILSGHSLGGIINIPYYGGLLKKDGAKTYINDYYVLNNTELLISNGLGYEKYNFRLLNTPSINIYRFEK